MIRPFLVLLASIVFGMFACAEAETNFLTEEPGWRSYMHKSGAITFTRADHSSADLAIYATAPVYDFPLDADGELDDEKLQEYIGDFIRIATEIDSDKCKTLVGVTPELAFMGMGYSVEAPSNTKCTLFVSALPSGKMFANIWVNDLEPDGKPYEKAKLFFLKLNVGLVIDEPLFPGLGVRTDLEKVAKSVSSEARPDYLMLYHNGAEMQVYPLYKDHPTANCAGWDPTFFSPSDLQKVRRKGDQVSEERLPCETYPWREMDLVSLIEIKLDGVWLARVDFAKRLSGGKAHFDTLRPFEPGQSISLTNGSKERLNEVIAGSSSLGLHENDVQFFPDGRFLAKSLNLDSESPIKKSASGRYYLLGHVGVFEWDDGPLVVGFVGKLETRVGPSKIFIGDMGFDLDQ